MPERVAVRPLPQVHRRVAGQLAMELAGQGARVRDRDFPGSDVRIVVNDGMADVRRYVRV